MPPLRSKLIVLDGWLSCNGIPVVRLIGVSGVHELPSDVLLDCMWKVNQTVYTLLTIVYTYMSSLQDPVLFSRDDIAIPAIPAANQSMPG